ncbi:MAG: hypothetical protein JJE22_07625 [Bacteroidia bacterium]|nr:hypothetical protein [Bacteroidia bacterium]
MKSNFDNGDFEQFVKQNADQYRMFPSEKVWNGIYNTIHTRRKWYGIGLTLLLLTIGTVTWVMLTPSNNKQAVPTKSSIVSQSNLVGFQKDQKQPVVIASDKTTTNSLPFVAGLNNWQKTEPGIENNEEVIAISVFKDQPNVERLASGNEKGSLKVSTPSNEEETGIINTFYNNKNVAGTLTDDNLDFYTDKTRTVIAANNTIAKRNEIYPLSIESVVNSFSATDNRKKWLFQIYFAPTISYRKLVENKSSLTSLQPSPFNYAAVYDINSVVTHKPDMGFELGLSAAYPLSKNLRITGGFQFNVSKYDIKAYNYPTEFVTIALNNGSGSTSSVSTATNYRNFDGYKTNWLHNLYLSASLPVGVELKLSGDTKNYIGIGGTFQPTYILGDRAYMISTDYKNYVEIPQLIRKWNVNTSFEAFAGYSTGKINWKIGPQVRYQLLSSFQKKYPVKEHLFDFGLKVGIMLNN